MESPAPVSRYIQKNSKKRVFPGGGSSSSATSGCKDVEGLEISPSIGLSAKANSKQKEVLFHEIINVDMEEDFGDAMLTDGKFDTSLKGKEAFSYSSVGFASSEDGESGEIGDVYSGEDDLAATIEVGKLHDSVNLDESSSNMFYGEDEWIDTYYDDILYDDYAILESHFDHMDIPPGVEAPFPWLPSSPKNDVKGPEACPSTNLSSHLQPNASNPFSSLDTKFILPSYPLENGQVEDPPIPPGSLTAGLKTTTGRQNKEKLRSKWRKYDQAQKKLAMSSSMAYLKSETSKGSSSHNSGKESLHSYGKSKRKSRASHLYSNLYNQFPSGSVHSSTVVGGSSYPDLNMPANAPGVGPYMPAWKDFSMNESEPLGPVGAYTGSTSSGWIENPVSYQNDPSFIGTSPPPKIEERNVDEVLQKFDNFKKFDTVEDFSDHHYSKNGSSAKQPSKNWAKRIQEEWKILEKNLPDEIFVRVYESRMDLLRAVIVGAEGTPYHDGLFFFDVFFPSSYPNVPPHVHYHSGGLEINPNLYHCGKVCLSLLNTWSGGKKEKWLSGVSTMLQVLVSIQGLILNAKPYFNEPGYANMSGSAGGEKRALEYNETTFIYSLKTMVYSMRRPPKYFEDFVIGHFCKHYRDILVSCKAYMDGAQVGCLVKGGVQDVDEGDKSCSQGFKNKLAAFIPVLIKTFSENGAKGCEEFLYLAEKGNGDATARPRRGLKILN